MFINMLSLRTVKETNPKIHALLFIILLFWYIFVLIYIEKQN